MPCPCCGRVITSSYPVINPNTLRAHWNTDFVRLTPGEARLTQFFIERAPARLPLRTLAVEYYGANEFNEFEYTCLARTTIQAIRRKLGRIGWTISNVWSYGYAIELDTGQFYKIGRKAPRAPTAPITSHIRGE